ncbi:hypothetical protein CDAR_319171 [Caerostris darwini]|uniref:Uncharacterized protein n=1 Tax=Caerostris darwini TaxID=1538125 RepID=A0AAV4TYB9_9ARAC|nr:hypothetical protein CDAR_319171 [Caerostris darwini]
MFFLYILNSWNIFEIFEEPLFMNKKHLSNRGRFTVQCGIDIPLHSPSNTRRSSEKVSVDPRSPATDRVKISSHCDNDKLSLILARSCLCSESSTCKTIARVTGI